LTNIIQFPEKDRAMRTYKVLMTQEYIVQVQAFDEEDAAEEAEKIIENYPDDYCVGGTYNVERID